MHDGSHYRETPHATVCGVVYHTDLTTLFIDYSSIEPPGPPPATQEDIVVGAAYTFLKQKYGTMHFRAVSDSTTHIYSIKPAADAGQRHGVHDLESFLTAVFDGDVHDAFADFDMGLDVGGFYAGDEDTDDGGARGVHAPAVATATAGSEPAGSAGEHLFFEVVDPRPGRMRTACSDSAAVFRSGCIRVAARPPFAH